VNLSCPDSTYFFALSHAPPVLDIEMASCMRMNSTRPSENATAHTTATGTPHTAHHTHTQHAPARMTRWSQR
jgi:hypothetical protein